MSGLIVCATQRSGSTLLCELLDQPRQYLAGVSDPAVLDLLPPLDPGVPERTFDFDAVRRAGTTPNGVFAAKIMWSHTPDLWARLAGRTLEDVFGPLRYVQVVRRDKVAQAVGEQLIVAKVQDSIDAGRAHEDGPSRNRLQTVTLLDALSAGKFDAAFGGARRDEERARAKERVLSFRDELGQ